MKPLSALLLLATTLGCSSPAFAELKTISVVNNSGETIQSVTLDGEAEAFAGSTVSLASPIASGEDGSLQADLANGICVVNLAYQLNADHLIKQANVDLCSADGLVVE